MTIAIQSITTFEKGSILDEVAFIVCSGFKSKFTNALFSETEVYDVVYAFCYYLYTEKGENLLIATSDGKVCGCLFLTNKNDSHRHFYQSVSRFLPFSKRLKLLFLLSLLSHKPTTDERYIDFITVSSDFVAEVLGKRSFPIVRKLFILSDSLYMLQRIILTHISFTKILDFKWWKKKIVHSWVY